MNKSQNEKKQKRTRAGTSKQRHNDFDSIPMSRQLQIRKQTKSRLKRSPVKRAMNNKRLYTQNKSMPTLIDLEKLFEESSSLQNTVSTTDVDTGYTNIPRQTTTETSIVVEQNIIAYSMKERDRGIISNIENPYLNDNKVEVHKLSTDKLPETININKTVQPKVHCNEIVTIDDDEAVLSNEECKSVVNSLVNSQKRFSVHNEDLLKDDNGSDSDVTVVYDLEGPLLVSPTSSSPYKRFSPLPSTSTDSATILENDKIFLESLSSNKSRIQEAKPTQKQETLIVIDDDDYLEDLPCIYPKNTTPIESLRVISHIDDDVLVSTSSHVDDENIDIEKIIAYNKTILTKYKTFENLSEVIEVTPVENHPTTSNVAHNVSDSIEAHESPPPKRHKTNRVAPTTRETTANNVPHRNTVQLNSSTNNNRMNATNNNISLHDNNSPQMYSPNLSSSLTSNSFQNPDVSTGLNCPICLENLRSRECASTLCGHIFCMECIKRALRSAKRCPTCRKTIKGNNGFHKLFL